MTKQILWGLAQSATSRGVWEMTACRKSMMTMILTAANTATIAEMTDGFRADAVETFVSA